MTAALDLKKIHRTVERMVRMGLARRAEDSPSLVERMVRRGLVRRPVPPGQPDPETGIVTGRGYRLTARGRAAIVAAQRRRRQRERAKA